MVKKLTLLIVALASIVSAQYVGPPSGYTNQQIDNTGIITWQVQPTNGVIKLHNVSASQLKTAIGTCSGCLVADSIKAGAGIGVTYNPASVIITNTGGSSGVTEGYVDSTMNRRHVFRNGLKYGYSTGSDTIRVDTLTAALNGNALTASVSPAGTLTGSTLASGVTASSLTSVGTLTSLAVAGSLTAESGAFAVTGTNGDIATNGNITTVSGKINNITVTAPITAATLTITGGKTLSVTNNASVSGTNTGDQIIVQSAADSLFNGSYFNSGSYPNNNMVFGCTPGGAGGCELTHSQFDGNMGTDTVASLGSVRTVVGSYLPKVNFKDSANTRVSFPTGAVQGVGQGNSPTFAGETLTSTLTAVTANFSGQVTLSKSGDAIYMAKSTSSGNSFYEMNRSDNTKQDALIGYTNGNINWELGFGISDAGNDTDFTVRDLVNNTYPFNIKASNGHTSIGPLGADLGKTLGVSGTFGVSGAVTLSNLGGSGSGCVKNDNSGNLTTGSCTTGGADSNYISMTLGTLNMTNTFLGKIAWRNNAAITWDSSSLAFRVSKSLIDTGILYATGAVLAGSGSASMNSDGSVAFAGGLYTISSDGTQIITPASGLTMFAQTGGAEAGRQVIGGGSDSTNGAYSYWAGDDKGGTGLGGGSGTVLPITGGGFPKWKLQDKNYGTVIQYNGSAAHDLTITSDAIQFNGLSTSNFLITPNNVEAQVFFQADANVDLESGVKADMLAGAGNSGWCADSLGNLYRGTLITVATIANILQCN